MTPGRWDRNSGYRNTVPRPVDHSIEVSEAAKELFKAVHESPGLDAASRLVYAAGGKFKVTVELVGSDG